MRSNGFKRNFDSIPYEDNFSFRFIVCVIRNPCIILETWVVQLLRTMDFSIPLQNIWYRCRQNYPRPLNPMQRKQKKKKYFYNFRIKRKAIRGLYHWFESSQINSTQRRWRTMNLEVSYTQDLPPDDSNHNLDTPKCGIWKWWSLDSQCLSLSLEVEDKVSLKVIETLALIGYL